MTTTTMTTTTMRWRRRGCRQNTDVNDN